MEGREADGFMMLLLAAQEGYAVAQYGAAWVLEREYAHSIDKIILRGSRSRSYSTSISTSYSTNSNANNGNKFMPVRGVADARHVMALELLDQLALQTGAIGHMTGSLMLVRKISTFNCQSVEI